MRVAVFADSSPSSMDDGRGALGRGSADSGHQPAPRASSGGDSQRPPVPAHVAVESELAARAGVVGSIVRLGQQVREAAEEVAAHVVDLAQELDRERQGAPGGLGHSGHLQVLVAVRQLLARGRLSERARRELLSGLRAVVDDGA